MLFQRRHGIKIVLERELSLSIPGKLGKVSGKWTDKRERKIVNNLIWELKEFVGGMLIITLLM